MQGKLVQKCAHLLYYSALYLGGKVNTKRMPPDMGSIFHIKNHWNILVIGNYYVNYESYQILILSSSSDTKRTLMYLFLFTNSPLQRTGFNMYKSIRNINKLSLLYNLVLHHSLENFGSWKLNKCEIGIDYFLFKEVRNNKLKILGKT